MVITAKYRLEEAVAVRQSSLRARSDGSRIGQEDCEPAFQFFLQDGLESRVAGVTRVANITTTLISTTWITQTLPRALQAVEAARSP